MQPFRIAVATRRFNQRLKQSLQTAAEMGAQAVQFDVREEVRPAEFTATGRRQLLHYLGELGLRVASVSLPTRKSFHDEEGLEARLAATQAAMQFAFDLKAPILTARIGRIPADPESQPYRMLTEILNDVARHGNRVGTMFSITPSHDSPQALAELLGLITEGPMGIDFDPGGFVMSGQDPIEALRALNELVTHVRIRDAIQDVDGSGVEVPVGRGEVNWDEFLALIHEMDYRGWLTIDRTQGEDKVGDSARAIQYLRRVALG